MLFEGYLRCTTMELVDVIRKAPTEKSTALWARLGRFGLTKYKNIEKELAYSPIITSLDIARTVYEVLKPADVLRSYASCYETLYEWTGSATHTNDFYRLLATMLRKIADIQPVLEERGYSMRIVSERRMIFWITDAPSALQVDIIKPSGQVLYNLINVNLHKDGRRTVDFLNKKMATMQEKVKKRLARFTS